MNHTQLINKAITLMICAPQRRYTHRQMIEMVKTCNSSLEGKDLTQAVTELENDARIKRTRVSYRKVYYEYKGII